MEENEKIKALEDLVAGELTPAEEKELREQINQDPTLQNLLKTEEQLVAGIRHWSQNELRNRLRELEGALEPIHINPEGTAERSSGGRSGDPLNWKPLLVAASITLLVGLYFIFNTLTSPAPDELYKQFYEPYIGYAPVTKRNVQEIDTPLEKALTAYESGKYKLAAELFKLIPSNEQRDFYLANSYLASGEHQKALPLFEQLAETGAEPRSTVNWYLALTYLKNEDTKKSADILKQLVSSDNSYQAKARELLEDL